MTTNMIKLRTFFSSIIFILCLGLLPVVFVHAQDYGLGKTAVSAGLDKVGGTSDVTILTGQIIGTALSMIGIVFFILMIYSGLRWMTARGNSELTQKAQDTIIAATIGMVVVLASYAITTFVFGALPKAPGVQPATHAAVNPSCPTESSGICPAEDFVDTTISLVSG